MKISVHDVLDWVLILCLVLFVQHDDVQYDDCYTTFMSVVLRSMYLEVDWKSRPI